MHDPDKLVFTRNADHNAYLRKVPDRVVRAVVRHGRPQVDRLHYSGCRYHVSREAVALVPELKDFIDLVVVVVEHRVVTVMYVEMPPANRWVKAIGQGVSPKRARISTSDRPRKGRALGDAYTAEAYLDGRDYRPRHSRQAS